MAGKLFLLAACMILPCMGKLEREREQREYREEAEKERLEETFPDPAPLRWEMSGTDTVSADVEEKPRIAITFDDGPHPVYTEILLDALKERQITAGFFLIGENVKLYPELVRREHQEGHLIGNHTFHHVDLDKVSEETALEEIALTNEAIAEITGEVPEFIRPPFGIRKKELEQKIDAIPVLWNIDPLDWNTENVDEIVNKVVTEAKDGDIILLHDCYKSSVEAACQIMDRLTADGFLFVSPEQLILE